MPWYLRLLLLLTSVALMMGIILGFLLIRAHLVAGFDITIFGGGY